MKIEFKKIPNSGINFDISTKNVKFSGISVKIRNNLVKCTGSIKGSFPHICDRCGLEFINHMDENIEVYASDGIYEGDFLDVIEFFDNSVDFDSILLNEIESYKSDYLYCDKCKIKEN